MSTSLVLFRFIRGFLAQAFELPITYIVKINTLSCEEGGKGTVRKEGFFFGEKLMSLIEE